MQEVKTKKKGIPMKTGIHLAIINDYWLLRNADKTPLLSQDGFKQVVVGFINNNKESVEQVYVIDGGEREKFLHKMLQAAQVDNTKGAVSKKEVLGKRIWLAIQEVHYVCGDEIYTDSDGKYLPEYRIFRLSPVLDASNEPVIAGDPKRNGGVPARDFLKYQHVKDFFTKEHVEKPNAVQEEKAVEIVNNAPSFDDEEPTDIKPSIESEDIYSDIDL